MKKVSILHSPFSDCLREDSLHCQLAILTLSTHKKSLFSTRHSQNAHTKAVSILSSPFSDCLHEDTLHSQFSILKPVLEESLYSQFAVLMLSTRRQSPFSHRYSQTTCVQAVFILNFPFSDCPHKESLYSQLAILRLPT